MANKSTSWGKWFHGFLVTVGGGVLDSVAAFVVGANLAPETVWSAGFWKIVLGTAVFSGLRGAALYFKQSPIPKE